MTALNNNETLRARRKLLGGMAAGASGAALRGFRRTRAGASAAAEPLRQQSFWRKPGCAATRRAARRAGTAPAAMPTRSRGSRASPQRCSMSTARAW